MSFTKITLKNWWRHFNHLFTYLLIYFSCACHFSISKMLTVLMRNPLVKICFPWISASIPVRCLPVKGELDKGVHEAFISTQRQYTLHTGTAVEKLLCQHGLLTAKVTVSCVWGGLDTGRGGMDDGSRLQWRTEGGTLRMSGVPGRVTMRWLWSVPPLSHFYWHKSFYKGNGSIIYPLCLWSPSPHAVHLPVSACR